MYRPVVQQREGGGDEGGGDAYVVLLHEFDEEVHPEDLPDVQKDLEIIEPTKGCAFSIRAYKLIESEGFGGKCRMPERMEE